jgi:hypothetical protein
VGELVAIDVDADVAQVEGDAVEDVGNRVRRARVDLQLGGERVDREGGADHDRAEVEGPHRGGVDRHQRERLPVVWTGEVDPAGSVGEGGADPVALRVRPTWLASGQEGLAVSA